MIKINNTSNFDASADSPPPPIIIGLGNPLFQDEGLGIAVIHQLMKEGRLQKAELIDGGTDGLMLLEAVEKTDKLLIIDAIDDNQPAATIRKIDGSMIPLYGKNKLSPHQLSFQEVLALANLRGNLPKTITLIGVQPKSLDWGTELTPEVAKTVPMVIKMIYDEITAWIA